MTDRRLDPGPIGQATAKLMDTLAEEYPDGELTGALVIAEVSYIDEDGDDSTDYRWQSADDSPSRKVGMALYVLRGLM